MKPLNVLLLEIPGKATINPNTIEIDIAVIESTIVYHRPLRRNFTLIYPPGNVGFITYQPQLLEQEVKKMDINDINKSFCKIRP